nr:DUF2269 family protein [Sphingomonas bacterium]
MANRSVELAARRLIDRQVVLADWLFTTPAVIVQPVTGVWLARIAGSADHQLARRRDRTIPASRRLLAAGGRDPAADAPHRQFHA